MPAFSAACAANSAITSSYRPVALFVGGTSGVGRATAERLAHHTQGNVHIIICGRNKQSAEALITELPKSPDSLYEFIECDASLMKNVVLTATQLKARIPALNYLMLSQGILDFKGRAETSEGIDAKMALDFYSRWKFVDELLPLLKRAAEQGQDARVMTVLAAGYGGKIDLEDLGLKKTYGIMTTSLQVPTYNDLLVQEYAARHPEMSFIHIYPGFVSTSILSGSNHWVKIVLKPVIAIGAISPQKCGEWMLFALRSPLYSKGGFHISNHGDPVPSKKVIGTDEAREKLVAHYQAEVSKY